MRCRLEKNNLPAAARGHAPCEEVALYTVAGQTIFQIYGVSGSPSNQFESYLEIGYPIGAVVDRSTAIRRTKEEYETEQYALRGAWMRERCALIAESVISDMAHVSDQDAEYEIGIRNETARGIAESIREGLE